MARIRTIKPDYFRSESVASLDLGTRITWAGLWTYCDDEGRGVDNARIIKAELWALDDDYTHERVARDLDALEAQGMVCRYESDGKRCVHVVKWDEHQVISHPTASKLPGCPIHDADQHRSTSPEDSGKSPEDSGANPGDSGLEREKEQGKGKGTGNREDAPVGFAEFWVAYPRKVGKPGATRAWKRIPQKSHPAVMAGLARWNRSWTVAGTADEFIPHPATWLNDQRWESPPATHHPTLPQSSPADDAIAEYRRRNGLPDLRQGGAV